MRNNNYSQGSNHPSVHSQRICPGCGCPVEPNDKFCPNCWEELDPPIKSGQNSDQKYSLKKYIIAGICVFVLITAAGIGWFLASDLNTREDKTAEVTLKSIDEIEDPISYTTKAAWYKVSNAVPYYSMPFQQSGELGNLVQGETVAISRIAGKDGSNEEWGLTENGWALIQNLNTVNLEEIVMSQEPDVYGDYTALSSAFIYTSPYESEVTDDKVSSGDTVSLSLGMRDQFGTVWGKISSGKWVILESESQARFEKVQISQSPEDSSSKSSSQESSVTYIINNAPEPDSNPNLSGGDGDSSQPVLNQSDNSSSDTPSSSSQTSSHYILADSNSRYYSESELMAFDSKTLSYARNEIYARHGRLFRSSELQSYFSSQSWYNGTISSDDFDANHTGDLNDFETANAKLMLEVEKSKGKYNLN